MKRKIINNKYVKYLILNSELVITYNINFFFNIINIYYFNQYMYKENQM